MVLITSHQNLINRKRKKRIIKSFFLLLILFILAGIFYLLNQNPFVVKKINITTNYDVNNTPTIRILEKIKNQNIFILDANNLAQKIRSADIKIKSVVIEKEIPDKLNINIVKRDPLAAIFTNNKYFMVDIDGIIIEESQNNNNLPILNLSVGLQNLKVGSSIDNKDKIVLVIFDTLKNKKNINNITITNNEIIVYLIEGTQILLSSTDKITDKLTSLQTILSRFTIEGKRAKKIDLRFDKPVVTF
ncbi:MAG: FtsQ-type POTRA domain-containing protein [Candidatus Gottesmanbacteria bacterium]